MKMYGRIRVEIKGLSPLLMNRLNPESLKKKSRSTLKEYDEKVEARNSAYITEVNGEEQLFIPSYAVYSMMINTASSYRLGRKSLRSILAGTMRIEPEKILLGHCNYEVDTRPVVIRPSRVLRSRAKIPEWKATFHIVYNKKALPSGITKMLLEVLEDGGMRMGLLDFRPQHKGWFGTFEVTNFEEEENNESRGRS